MKETIKQTMVNRLHRRSSSSASSSTASVDYNSGDKLQFKFSSLQALQVPKGWDKLSLSIISVETGKTVAKTGRSSAQNGNCQWTETLIEYIDDASKGLDQCLYKLLISTGSGRSGILGDITVNLSGQMSSETSISIAQPLKNCSYGTILQVEIQCLTPRANLRNDGWTDTDSFIEDVNASDDLDTASDVSDGKVNKSQDSSMSSNFMYTSQEGGIIGTAGRRSGSSIDSMDDSFGREGYSPHRNPIEVANDLIGRRDSIGSSNSVQHSSYHVYDSSKITHPLYSSGSAKRIIVQKQDSGKFSHSISASPLRTFGPTESVLESEGATLEEVRAESRMWERYARKSKVDLDFSRKEFKDQTRKLQNACMEVQTLQTECDGLKQEVSYLKALLDESEFKEKATDNLKDNIQTELEEEMKFQRDMNDHLSLQLNKTQESNCELLSVLQELEETIEKQRLEIESLESSKDKVMELEKVCTELTKENVELVFNLKELSKQVSVSDNHILDSEIDPSYLQIRCDDLEIKCVELEVNIQGFKDKAFYLDGELNKYRAKAEERENEVSKLKELLKLQNEKKYHNAPENEVFSKTSEVEVLKSENLLKDRQIQRLKTQLSDLKILKKQLMGGLQAMQTESTTISECLDKVKNDMVVLNETKDSQIAANKILENKLLELESCNKELELHLTELELENLHLSERISGLEPQLRYLTDARESSRLDLQHSETLVTNLQAEIKKLEEDNEMNKADMRQKLQDMQQRWLEAQEECEYLKKANPKLQANAENLIEECSQLQKSNRELKQQRFDLYNRCTVLETELKDSQHNYTKFFKNLEDLEEKFSLMIDEIATKEKAFDSELEALYLKNEEQTQKLVMRENMFNQMYSEKMVEVENLQNEVAHLNTQIHSSHDEREKMASEAVHEMHLLRADKQKLEKSIQDVTEKFISSEKKLEESEGKIQDLMVEVAASKQNHEVLVTDHNKLMEVLDITRSNEEKLRIKVSEMDNHVKECEYERLQLTEEISSLKDQLQKIPVLQDEVVGLKNLLNDVKYENERLEASLQLVTSDYKELKEEKTSLLQRTSSMQKAVTELEDHKRSKVALEEQVMRLQGDLTAREALCAQDAELKNELGRLKRSNNQLQWKINGLQKEKDECLKNLQVLEEQLEQKKYLKPDEIECSTNSAISFRSDSMNSLHEDIKLSEDVGAKIQSLEKEIAEALEANDMYKAQINSFMCEEKVDKQGSSLETELKELQERYLHMSLKYAEVEAQREDLVSKLKAARPGKSWFS